jgi:hypothetical protein
MTPRRTARRTSLPPRCAPRGTRQGKSEEDRDKSHRDPKARRLKHLDQVKLTELPASVDACEDRLRIRGNCSTSGSA